MFEAELLNNLSIQIEIISTIKSRIFLKFNLITNLINVITKSRAVTIIYIIKLRTIIIYIIKLSARIIYIAKSRTIVIIGKLVIKNIKSIIIIRYIINKYYIIELDRWWI